jgi:hypothetical protein
VAAEIVRHKGVVVYAAVSPKLPAAVPDNL